MEQFLWSIIQLLNSSTQKCGWFLFIDLIPAILLILFDIAECILVDFLGISVHKIFSSLNREKTVEKELCMIVPL